MRAEAREGRKGGSAGAQMEYLKIQTPQRRSNLNSLQEKEKYLPKKNKFEETAVEDLVRERIRRREEACGLRRGVEGLRGAYGDDKNQQDIKKVIKRVLSHGRWIKGRGK